MAALSELRQQACRQAAHELLAKIKVGSPDEIDLEVLAYAASIEPAMKKVAGSLRVSALVWSNGRYGSRANETLVRAPVLAEASMPRVLAPGDRSNVTLDVQNFTGKAGTFRVRVEGIGPLSVAEGTRNVTLAPDARETLTFPLQAKSGFTTAQVRVRVEGNGHRVDRRHDLPVRAAWPQVTRTRSDVVQGSGAIALDTTLADGLLPESVRGRLVVGAVPPIPFAAALEDVLRYPYGCAEQTTSKAFAALVLDDATARLLGVQPLGDKARRERIEGALARLAGMQLPSGHFSLWGADEVDPALRDLRKPIRIMGQKNRRDVCGPLLERQVEVGSLRPRVVDRGEEQPRSVTFDEHPFVA